MKNLDIIEFIDEFLREQEDVLYGIEGRDCTKSRKYLGMLKKQLFIPDVRRMFQTSFKDKNGIIMREGDYISLTETKTMNNHYYNGMSANGKTFVNRDSYKEWQQTGTVIYLIKWFGDCLVADRVKEIGDPHPSLSTGFHYLNNCFESKKYKIEGNKHEGWNLGDYT